MKLKTISTGSNGNCYILTSDSGKHLMLDAGIPLAEIKQGIDFDVENISGAIITHNHLDHAASVQHLKDMGIKVFQPYLDTEHKRLKTTLGEFTIQSFPVPHSVECRAFIIEVEGQKILYATDFEYIEYSFKNYGIDTMLIEMNYQTKFLENRELDEHMVHVVTGHASDRVTTDFILNNKKYLRNVFLCHYSKSGNLLMDEAIETLKSKLPKYTRVEWARPGSVFDISTLPF